MDTNSMLNEIIAQAQADGTLVTSGDTTTAVAALAVVLLIMFGIGALITLFVVIGRAMTVRKMGGKGWTQIIPVYSEWVLATKAGCSKGICIALTVLDAVVWIAYFGAFASTSSSDSVIGDIFLLCYIALFVLACIVYRQVARRFGKGGGFTAGLVILPFIFFMILGCGSSKFEDEAAAE